jgi:hypothetical protein
MVAAISKEGEVLKKFGSQNPITLKDKLYMTNIKEDGVVMGY